MVQTTFNGAGASAVCESAGTGRQARLRGVCQPTWEFKSPLSHQKTPIRSDGCFLVRERRLESVSEHAIGHVRPPVQKLVDTLISFSRPPQAKKKCKQVSSLAPLRNGPGKIEQAQARVSRERKRNANKSPLSQKDEYPSFFRRRYLNQYSKACSVYFLFANCMPALYNETVQRKRQPKGCVDRGGPSMRIAVITGASAGIGREFV